MLLITYINHYRRFLTRSITSFIVNLFFTHSKDIPKDNNIRRILIVRPNSRLGNQLLLSPLIDTLHDRYPAAKIDLFVRGGISEVLFKHHEEIETYFKLPGKPFKELKAYMDCWIALRKQKYDWLINVDYDSSSGRLATLLARADYKLIGKPIDGLQAQFNDYKHMAKRPVYHVLHSLGQLQNSFQSQSFPRLNIRLQEAELAKGHIELMTITENNPKVIGVFTYATGDKIISKKWWMACVNRLKFEFPQHAVVEFLPKENVSQVDFSVPSYNSSDLRLIASMMHHCDFVIAADSGMMHLASASQCTTIGLFRVTDADKYGPYGGCNFIFKPDESASSELFERLHVTA